MKSLLKLVLSIVIVLSAVNAIMISIARTKCQEKHNKCMNDCPSKRCSYHYASGLWGGNCRVHCGDQ